MCMCLMFVLICGLFMVLGFVLICGVQIVSVYSPLSDRVGLPLHNIPSHVFLSWTSSCQSQALSYPFLHSLTMSFLPFQPVFCLQLYLVLTRSVISFLAIDMDGLLNNLV